MLVKETPRLIISSSEIEDGETMKITCTLPIDYGGGVCRLFRENSKRVFRETKESGFLCVFLLSSRELLGRRPVGSRVYFTCDYHLQEYTSVQSNVRGVTVWGSSPSPGLSLSRRFLSPEDSVEVTCSSPLGPVASCHFFRGQIHVAHGACSRNLTSQQLAVWEKPALLLPVNLTCRYYPHPKLQIRSEPSNHNVLFVLDVSQVSTSMDCNVSVDIDQLAGFGERSWTSVGADGQTVTVQVSNRILTTNNTCDPIHTALTPTGQ
uniref:uncharacterized protein n=1 Tax=Semicossyphus pulcher TaxID=241346 RepID=UPI0037E88B84